jgi:hypothetical protein
MLRYWQAYMSVKDTLYPHPVERTLTVYQEVVQIRLSILAVTIGAFLFAHITATLVRTTNHKNGVWRIHLPSSRLGWMAQAAREQGCHAGSKAIPPHDRFNPRLFASRNQGLALIITPDLEPRIVTTNDISVPLLEYTTAGSMNLNGISDLNLPPAVGLVLPDDSQSCQGMSSFRTSQDTGHRHHPRFGYHGLDII